MDFFSQINNIKEQVNFSESFKRGNYRFVLVAGMGGSGVSGRIFSELCTKLHITVVDSYSLPEYVDETYFIICVSYSGNTEETISVANMAHQRGFKVHAITTGGKLKSIADEIIEIPGGLQPRQALGYLLIPMINTFIGITDSERKKIANSIEFVNNEEVKKLAENITLSGKIPYVISWEPYASMSYRTKTQFNENSKLPAISHVLSEQNHNELVPLSMNEKMKNSFFYISIDGDPNSRNQKRMDLMEKTSGIRFHHIVPKGDSYLARYFYLIHFIDLLTYYTGIALKYEPEDVGVLEKLKKELDSII